MSNQKERSIYLDNIKIVLTVLVIMVHISVTYGGSGGWYYYEHTDDQISGILLTIFNAVTQSYFMGFFFFISAYFIPSSLDKRGSADFIKSKLIRLGIPLVIFSFIINPLILFADRKIIHHENGSIFYLFSKYKSHIFGNGPLWFVQALIVFSIIYVIGRKLNRNRSNKKIPLPSNKKIYIYLLITGAAAFIFRFFYPAGKTFMGMQFGYFASYILLFIAGIYSYRNNWLSQITESKARYWFKISIIAFIVFPIGFALGGDAKNFMGGLSWQAFFYAMWEPFILTGIILKYIVYFRKRFNNHGNISSFLAKNSYSVYIIHAPILVLLSYGLMWLKIHPLMKFSLVTLITVPLCYIVSHLFVRKVPVLKNIL